MAFCNFFLKIPFVAVFYLNNSKKKIDCRSVAVLREPFNMLDVRAEE